MQEKDLYEPMCKWLEQYLQDKYKHFEIIVADTSTERLDKALEKFGVTIEQANGVDIQIDVLGIAKKNGTVKVFFIEAKKNSLTLRDLGQLWAYCKLIDPDEAWLLTAGDLGSLRKLIMSFNREDLLDFGDGKRIKKMKIGIWDVRKKMPDFSNMFPRI